MTLIRSIFFCSLLLLSSCSSPPFPPSPPTPPDPISVSGSLSRVCVAIGVEDGVAGPCPGANLDARSIFDACVSLGFSAALLQTAAATWPRCRETVLSSAAKLKPGDLLVIAMSGHGGQTPDDNGDEPDGQDETICFYDQVVRDDLILELLRSLPPGLRILLISDQCHSEGNFRSAARVVQRTVSLGAWGKISARALIRSAPPDFSGQLIQFAGCREAAYSYGSDSGGTWTQSTLAALPPSPSYCAWFTNAAARMPASQIPIYVESANVTDQFRNGAPLQ